MKARSILFLKDILVIAVTAFGGPQAHLVQMLKYLVHKHKFITEDDLMETVAFCQMLPGPSSTQTITAIAFKKGGVLLAVLSLIIWILPATAIMMAITLLFSMFERDNFSTEFLIYMQPMAIGFIVFAGYRIGIAVIKTQTTFFIMLGACLLSILFYTPFIFPAILIAGGVLSTLTNKKDHKTDVEKSLFSWTNFWVSSILFFGIFILAGVLGAVTKSQPLISEPVVLFENFYRFGAITFGGGQVLVPLMFEQFVHHKDYLTANEFISGYAFNQAVPGPTFSFAAFTGGLALRHLGMQFIFTGCIIATVAIYLPGALLVLFLYPLWQYIKNYKYIYRSLAGVNAAATGLVFGAAYNIYFALNFAWTNIFIVIATFGLLRFTKIPPPVLVLIALGAGEVYQFFSLR